MRLIRIIMWNTMNQHQCMYALCMKILCDDYGVDSNNDLLLVRLGDDSKPVHDDDNDGY